MLKYKKHDQACPTFENPPVIETVLSVQFDTLQALSTVHFGLFWQKVRDRFPATQDHPALSPVIERPQDSTLVPRMRFEAMDSLVPQRLWLLNETNTEMIQLQNDRFIKNWRSMDGNRKYPRYAASIKPAFKQNFKEFQDFVATQGLGEVKINQCEVTYVNHIVAGEGWSGWEDIGNVFTFWKDTPSQQYPGKAEDYSFRARYPIFGSNKEWIGRLHVEIQPARRITDNKQMYAMSLTARGMCGKDFDFFDIGHESIVKSFKNLTTPNMHRIWEER